jgi:hypothetical protein
MRRARPSARRSASARNPPMQPESEARKTNPASPRRNRPDRGFFYGFEDLLDGLRVQGRAAVERNHDPSTSARQNPP